MYFFDHAVPRYTAVGGNFFGNSIVRRFVGTQSLLRRVAEPLISIICATKIKSLHVAANIAINNTKSYVSKNLLFSEKESVFIILNILQKLKTNFGDVIYNRFCIIFIVSWIGRDFLYFCIEVCEHGNFSILYFCS